MALENKLGITDSIELAHREEQLTKKRAQELYDKRILDTFAVGTYAGLSQIHGYLFQDVYAFAGKMRTVNIAKGNCRFAPLLYLSDALKQELGKVVDWSKVDKEDYLAAMERSPVRPLEIKALFKAALTDKINDRAVYRKGIDASYRYEGYSTYRTENL